MRITDVVNTKLGSLTVDDLFVYLDDKDGYGSDYGWIARIYYQHGIPNGFRECVSDQLEIIKKILSPLDTPILIVYRGLNHPMSFDQNNEHWTDSEKSARRFGPYVYKAIIPNTMVDWAGTVLHRMGFPHEHEITLVSNAKPNHVVRLDEKMIDKLGQEGRLFLNPTRAEFSSINDKSEMIRMLLDPDTGDVYAWDGYYAAHGAIKDRYSHSAFHLVTSTYAPNQILVLTMWRYERQGYTEQQVRDLVTNNPTLKHLFPRMKLVIQP